MIQIILALHAFTALATDLPHFAKVNDNLYRGGRPSPQGMQQLKALGVKTIIDLQGGDLHSFYFPYVYFSEPGERVKKINEEQAYVEGELELKFYSFPINSMKKITDAESKMFFNQVLPAIEDPKNQPVYVHCEHGQDRTGLIVALERMRINDEKLGRPLTAKEAYDEWYGFGHGKFLNQVFTGKLDRYFKKIYPEAFQ